MDCDCDAAIEKYPAMHLPLRDIGDLVFLRVLRYLLIQIRGMQVAPFKEPEEQCPLGPVLQSPGGFYRDSGVHDGIDVSLNGWKR